MNFWLLRCNSSSLPHQPKPLPEYPVGGKPIKRSSIYTFDKFLDDNPQLQHLRVEPLPALFCVVRARFMSFPSTLRVVVRYPHKLFRKFIKEKTVVTFSFNIDEWEKVPKARHTFENSSVKEFVHY